MQTDQNKSTSSSDVKRAEKKVEELGKELYHKIINWVKIHPILTLVFSFSVSVASNLVSQWLWNFFH